MKASFGRLLPFVLAGILLVVAPLPLNAETPPDTLWYGVCDDGTPQVHLWFFWSQTCPHCRKAKPTLKRIENDLPWVKVHALDISRPVAREMYELTAQTMETEINSVPAFFFCGDSMVGFGSDEVTGGELRRRLAACRARRIAGDSDVEGIAEPASDTMVDVPFFGPVDVHRMSLPLVTVMIAGIDAFNPCTFFILLFLLSLLVHAPSRFRMALIGGIFVGTSGLIYFAFMAAWLNLFLFVGEMRWITTVAAVIAIVFAGLNIKDFIGVKRGGSLSMSSGAQADIFARMRRLLQSASLPTMLTGTVVLALAANAYELACTSGLPMVYTRILTLNALPSGGYYLFLALYNLIYVVPLAAIVAVFVVTLGSRKLQDHEGKTLKLMSGIMMLGLGATLLVDPAALSDLRVAAGIVLGAVVVATIGFWWRRPAGR